MCISGHVEVQSSGEIVGGDGNPVEFSISYRLRFSDKGINGPGCIIFI